MDYTLISEQEYNDQRYSLLKKVEIRCHILNSE
jgi:hypothetical protein